jgi:hypothetical protein
VSDTKSELGTVLIYITLINSLERIDINLRLYCLIPLGVLRMPDKSQEYPRIYYSKTPLPNSTLRGSNIKPSTFIYSNPLN